MNGPEQGLVVIHGHFYQPPRENPWTGEVDAEPSAAPDHDWNVRVTRETYEPLVSVGIDDGDKRIKVPVYEYLSFDFGPTLLDWMEREAREIHDVVIRADRASVERLGAGNALAMPYHHIILPLASRRDKETEVRWGIDDFKRRFGRDPVGFWLPETAVDRESLDVIAAARHLRRRPVFFVSCDQDDRFSAAQARNLWHAAGAKDTLWVLPDCGHNGAWKSHRVEYERRVLGFFDASLSPLARP